jgi:thermitase
MTRVLAFIVLVLAVAFISASCFRIAQGAPETVPECYAVRLPAGAQTPPHPSKSAEPLGLNWYRVTAETQAKVETEYAGKYDAIEPCYVVTTHQQPDALTNDPSLSQQWGLARVNAPTAWDVSKGAGKVVVVVFDTGLDTLHADMGGKWYGGKSYVSTPSDFRDPNGHGTHTSGIIAAATNNALGVAGVGYNVKVSVAQVLGANGSGDTARIAQATIEATNAIPSGWKAVSNYSLGCECPPSQIFADAAAYAASKDIVLIASAGNSNADMRHRSFYPAAYPQFISVSATDFGDRRAVFSNYGRVSIAAPGVDILSTWPGGYRSASGTSMAAPHVTATAALVRTAHPGWTAAQVRQALLATARKPIGYNELHHGAGVVDAGKAVRYGGAVVTPPTAQPRVTPVATSTPAVGGREGVEAEALINTWRLSLGLPTLRHDNRLALAAATHNATMDRLACFSHQCPGEPDPWQRIRATGYPMVAGSEVIGRGYPTARDMVNGWILSGSHSAILRSTSYTDIGCAHLDGANGHYLGMWWTCNPARATSASGVLDLFSLPGPLGVTHE